MPENEVALAKLRSHEIHMKYIYGVRFAGLLVSGLTIMTGAVMVFKGLQGSFNWAVEVPNSIGAKLTNASPGIVFATIGLVLAFFVILQRPVSYETNDDDMRVGIAAGADAGREYVRAKAKEYKESLEKLRVRSQSNRDET